MALSRSTGGREATGGLSETFPLRARGEFGIRVPLPPVLPLISDGGGGGLKIGPPLSDWTRPSHCNILATLAEEHGPLMFLRIQRGAPRWSQLDDAAREVVGAEHSRPPDERGLWVWYQNAWVLTTKSYLPGIVDRLSTLRGLKYLQVRDAPDAVSCQHIRCPRLRGKTQSAPQARPPRTRSRRSTTTVAHVGPQALYRFYDNHGHLLYIGITMDLGSRWYAHDRGKPWWTDVASATVEHYPSRDAVLAAEAAAIQRERPLWNVMHNT